MQYGFVGRGGGRGTGVTGVCRERTGTTSKAQAGGRSAGGGEGSAGVAGLSAGVAGGARSAGWRGVG
jgi:hypothetical protein